MEKWLIGAENLEDDGVFLRSFMTKLGFREDRLVNLEEYLGFNFRSFLFYRYEAIVGSEIAGSLWGEAGSVSAKAIPNMDEEIFDEEAIHTALEVLKGNYFSQIGDVAQRGVVDILVSSTNVDGVVDALRIYVQEKGNVWVYIIESLYAKGVRDEWLISCFCELVADEKTSERVRQVCLNVLMREYSFGGVIDILSSFANEPFICRMLVGRLLNWDRSVTEDFLNVNYDLDEKSLYYVSYLLAWLVENCNCDSEGIASLLLTTLLIQNPSNLDQVMEHVACWAKEKQVPGGVQAWEAFQVLEDKCMSVGILQYVGGVGYDYEEIDYIEN